MGTTAQTFYLPGTPQTDWDGTDPAGGDVRKLRPSSAAEADATTIATFPTSPTSIVLDPYSTRTTTGTGDRERFGWAFNMSGADGLEATAAAHRLIPAGAWTFVVELSGVVVSQYVANASVWRLSSDGATKTLLFAASSNNLTVAVAFGAFQWSSSSQPAYTIAPDESLMCCITLTKNSASVGAETVNLRCGNGASGSRVLTPSPGVRTLYAESITVDAVGTAAVTFGTKTVTGVVRDSAGAPVDGATVKLFDESTDTRISTDTTTADGVYAFTRTDVDTAEYYCVGYLGDTLHGTTDRSLTAT